MRALLVMMGLVACSRGSQPEATMVATLTDDGVTFSRIERDGVKEVGHVEGVATAGWLDRRTVIGFEVGSDDTDGTAATVRRIVEGKLAETIKLDQREWPYEYHESGALLFTKNGEVWVARCDPEDEGCEDDLRPDHFLRVWPQPRQVRKTKPAGIIKHHAMRFGEDSTWSPPTRPAAPGVNLKREKVTAVDEDGKSGPTNGLVCEAKGGRFVFPTDCCKTPPGGYEEVKHRWVMTDPPIYEIAAKGDFYGHRGVTSVYFRACEPNILTLAKLDDRRWAHFQRDKDAVFDGTWTIFDGSRKVGTIAGYGAIRPNR